jgi:Type I restriction modification DNA specificity domain
MTQWIALGDGEVVTVLRGPSPSALAAAGTVAVHSPHTLFNELAPAGFLDASKAARYPGTQADDLLVAIAHPGKRYVFRVPSGRDPFVPTNHWALVRPSSRAIASAEYLETWFLTPAFRAELDRYATGQTIQRVSLADFKKLRIPVPPLAAQREVAATIQGLSTAAQKYSNVVDAIRAMKDRELADLATRLMAEFGAGEGSHGHR